MKLKKWFTLIEMLIVIVIVGILLTVGMGLSRSNLEKLKAKAITEEITGFFDTIFLQVNASNYQNSQPYTELQLQLSSGLSEIPYTYFSASSEHQNLNFTFAGHFVITGLSGDTSSIEKADILYSPFSPTCKLSTPERESDFSFLSFSIRPKGREEACFSLEKKYCKLRAISCK